MSVVCAWVKVAKKQYIDCYLDLLSIDCVTLTTTDCLRRSGVELGYGRYDVQFNQKACRATTES